MPTPAVEHAPARDASHPAAPQLAARHPAAPPPAVEAIAHPPDTRLPPGDEVRAALAGFFGGFGVEAPAQLARLMAWALGGAPCHSAPEALARARTCMEAWWSRVLGARPADTHLLARARAAFLLCGGARRWPHLLGAAEVPEGVASTLRQAVPIPAQAPCSMPEQQLVLWPWLETLRRWWRASQADLPVP